MIRTFALSLGLAMVCAGASAQQQAPSTLGLPPGVSGIPTGTPGEAKLPAVPGGGLALGADSQKTPDQSAGTRNYSRGYESSTTLSRRREQ